MHCRHRLTGTTGIDRQEPLEDDVSICVNCGGLSLYNADKTLRAASDEEINAIKKEIGEQNPELLEILHKSQYFLKVMRASREN